jgi:DnaJ like chaperone protein
LFKYLIALATLLFTRSAILALVVFFAASVFERFTNLGSGAVNPLGSGKRKSVFLETVFLLMGSLAKADGRVSVEEVEHAEHIFSQLSLSPPHRQQAIDLFKQGAEDDYDLNATLDKFMNVCGSTRSLRQALLAYLITLAFADGEFHEKEKKLLEQIAARLNFDQAAFQQLLDMIQNQSHFADGKVPTQNALESAYKALGVSESVSNQDLKKAYRRLMSQNHPDKLMGQGMPEDMIKVATERAKEIQKAYELIKEHREE